jgi:hypothetical protein
MSTAMLTLTHFINIAHNEVVIFDRLHEFKKAEAENLCISQSVCSLCIVFFLQSVHFPT